MDFDLFELDEDDEILNSVFLQTLQQSESKQLTETQQYTSVDVLPEFQCSGEDSTRAEFTSESFIKSGYPLTSNHSTPSSTREITLTAYDFRATNLRSPSMAQFMFGDTFMNIQHLWAAIKSPIGGTGDLSYYQRRRQITQFLHLLLHCSHEEQWRYLWAQLGNLRRLLNRVTEFDIWKLVYFANSAKGNECSSPAYHFLHGALEWKLLDLCILQKYETKQARSIESANTSVLLNQLERVFMDLVQCCLYLYAKKRPAELLYSSPFACTCIKEFWLFLQFAIQKWFTEESSVSEEGKVTFWMLFNKTMNKLRNNQEKHSLTLSSLSEFSIWLLCGLNRLFGFHSNGKYEGPENRRAQSNEADNGDFCELCTKQFLAAQPTEEQLRVFICLLTPTLIQWWRPKAAIPILLWEHFHKRLNSSFFIPGSAPSNLAVACASGKTYLEKYRGLLEKDTVDANLSSYPLFVLLMGKTLQRLPQSQGQKLLGRIYTKFSLQKFLALNETGIHHLIELFLVLALSGDFNDLAPKLSSKLLSISFDKVTTSRQVAVAKGHVAFLILYAERQCNLTEYVNKLLQQLASVRNDLAVSKVFAEGLLDIFKQTHDFTHGEQGLIEAWLPNFLNNCTSVEQDRCLEALSRVFNKIQQSEHLSEPNTELIKAMNAFVLPFVKQQYATSFSRWIPQLAADFCVYGADTGCFLRLFNFFADSNAANREALPQFMLRMLNSNKTKLVETTVIMHVWVKSLVLLTALNEAVVELTKVVVQLPAFNELTNLDASEVLQAKEPLCVFVAAVGKNYDSCYETQKRGQISENFNSYLRNFDKWLLADLKQEKTEVIFRFYSFLAIVIYNCPNIVYAKSKITCFFHVAITRFILPTSVQTGKSPEGKLAQIVHKIWPVLVQGIGRLSFKTDAYIGKTLNDLVQKWTPHFKVSSNAKVVARPFITCLQGDNAELSLYLCERLTSSFLLTQRRQADPNACLVVTIFQEIVEALTSSTETNEKRLEIFMKGSSLLMLEHIMMVDEVVPSRGLLLELFKRLTASRTYKNSSSLKALLAEHLRLLAKKHLAYYTFFYFELLTKLAPVSHELVHEVLNFVRAEVRIVEGKRGAGADNRIRGCLQQLEQCLDMEKRKCGH